MRGERFARRPLALEGFALNQPRRSLRRQFVLGRGGLGVLQLKLQLVEQALLAFGAHAVERAPQLFDLEFQIDDQRIGAGGGAAALIPLSFRSLSAGLALPTRCAFGPANATHSPWYRRMRGGEV